MGFLNRIKTWRRRPSRPCPVERTEVFQAKYAGFKELLDANAELLNIIADLEENLQEGRVFGLTYVRTLAARTISQARRMIEALEVISGRKAPALKQVLERIDHQLGVLFEQPKQVRPDALVLSYDQISREMVDWVGGKNANLGEVRRALKLPTPDGFAVTTLGYERFMAYEGLGAAVASKLKTLGHHSPENIPAVGAAVRNLISTAALPPDLTKALDAGAARVAERCPDRSSCRLALRSSAVGEDGELTFAGQYQSELNIRAEAVPAVYRRIVASLYTDRAMMYRLAKGIGESGIAMGVACLRMVPAVASGVVYSRDPADPLQFHILINAVWGLGPYAVDGVVTPDVYVVDRKHIRILVQHVAHKPVQLVMQSGAGVCEAAVAPERQDAPCLNSAQIIQLAEFAIRLEVHFGAPQDIEWALAPDQGLVVMQARPLSLVASGKMRARQSMERYSNHAVLTEGGIAVYPGAGCGPAFHVNSDQDLTRFPEGAVLVARRSSPRFVIVMPKARAIVTEVGSVTGHMASLAREFKVPTILEVKDARKFLPAGMEITVDAYAGVVYQGRVEPLLDVQPPPAPAFRAGAAFRALRQATDLIVPLHLVDPKSADFSPAACQTVHDIMRVVHELCYVEMFQLGEAISGREGAAIKIDLPLAVDLYLIDLGGARSAGVKAGKKVQLSELASFPLKAFLKGLMHEGLRRAEPRPVDLSGFFAVMSEQMLSPPAQSEGIGDRSYALASDKYLNFSSRVGYHYSILDCYCGASISKNYITFSFKGGAADDVRRGRRARAIARILAALDFAVETKGDQVDARVVKFEKAIIEQRLEQLGCLLQFTRQMDMLMDSETSVEKVAQSFLRGDCELPVK